MLCRRLSVAGACCYALATIVYLLAFGFSTQGLRGSDPAAPQLAGSDSDLASPGSADSATLAESRSAARMVVSAAVPESLAAPARPSNTGPQTSQTSRPASAATVDAIGPAANEPAAEAAGTAELQEAAAELVRDASVSVAAGLEAAGLDAAVPAAARANGPVVAGRTQPKLVVPPRSADGVYTVVPGREVAAAAPGAQVIRYVVEVERGLPFDAQEFATDVHRILNDPRGWGGTGKLGFERVDHGPVRLRVSLSSPVLTDVQCAPLRTFGRVSCWNGTRAVINALRWGTGAATYGDDILSYREYLISHEVGHGLGHRHVSCTEPGKPAPIMVQQTKSLEGCHPNPWPNPSQQS